MPGVVDRLPGVRVDLSRAVEGGGGGRMCWPVVLAAKESTVGDEVSDVAAVRSDQVGGFVRRKGGEKSRGSVEWRTPIRGARSWTTAGRWR